MRLKPRLDATKPGVGNYLTRCADTPGMPTIARTPDVLSLVRAAVTVDAQAAANHNEFISKTEQAAMSAGLLKDTADEMRAAGHSHVTATSVTELVTAKIAAVLGQVNQPSGSGATSVSQAEVRAAAALSPESGVRLARAYELITGRHIDVAGNTAPVVTPPVVPPAGTPTGLQAITGATTTPGLGLTLQTGGALLIDGGGLSGTSFSVDVGGRTISARIPDHRMSGRAGNVALVSDVVEALRTAAAAQGLDVRVTAHGGNKSTVELWPAGSAPPPPTQPTYLHAGLTDASGAYKQGLEVRGPLRFQGSNWNPGDHLVVQLDGKRYDVVVGTTEPFGELRRQMQADGRTVDWRDYGSWGSFRVTG